MEEEIGRRFEELERKIDATYESSEKTRKYFLVVLVVTVVAFIFPLIGLIFAIPAFLSTYSSLSGLLQ